MERETHRVLKCHQNKVKYSLFKTYICIHNHFVEIFSLVSKAVQSLDKDKQGLVSLNDLLVFYICIFIIWLKSSAKIYYVTKIIIFHQNE